MIEHYRHQFNGEWVLSTLDGLDAALKIKSIGSLLKLSEVYDRVQLSATEHTSIEDNLLA